MSKPLPSSPRSVGRPADRGAQVVRIPSRRRGGAPLTLESRVASRRCACPRPLARPTADGGNPFLPSSVLGNRARLQPAGRFFIRRPLFLIQRLVMNCDGMTCYFVNLSGLYEIFPAASLTPCHLICSFARIFDLPGRFSDTSRFACAIFIGDTTELIPSSVNY